jgi:hypothetical protein
MATGLGGAKRSAAGRLGWGETGLAKVAFEIHIYIITFEYTLSRKT